MGDPLETLTIYALQGHPALDNLMGDLMGDPRI